MRTAPAGHVVEARHQVRQRGLARAAGAHQRHHFAGLHLQVERLQLEAVRRAADSGSRRCRTESTSAKSRELRRARLSLNLLIAVQVFEDFLRRAQGLLEDLWMPASRFTGSYSISSAITKLVNSPGASWCRVLICMRA